MTTDSGSAAALPLWTLQDKLRKARVSAGLDQQQLADATGISRNSISNYENGTTVPRRPQLTVIAMACGVPVEWLADAASPKEPKPTKAPKIRGFTHHPVSPQPHPVGAVAA